MDDTNLYDKLKKDVKAIENDYELSLISIGLLYHILSSLEKDKIEISDDLFKKASGIIGKEIIFDYESSYYGIMTYLKKWLDEK